MGTVRAEKRMEEKVHVLLRGLYLRKGRGERNSMYSRVNCTCGKEDGGESVCITAGIVPAEREGRAKTHVRLRELYLLERGWGRIRMYAAPRSGTLYAGAGVEIEGC